MKKFLVMPDSFKGTMTSIEACDIIESAILDICKDAKVKKIPIADGGEGSVDCFLQSLGGERIYETVSDPNFQKISAFYGLIDGKTAVIEMATCAGLILTKEKNPEKTTTYGVGELIDAAISKGANKIIIGLGGSSTNDCGTGMLSALGAIFYDENMQPFVPVGGTLSKIRKICLKKLEEKIKGVQIVTMCDIENPLYGVNGSSRIYAKQKGATDIMIENLERNVLCFADFCTKENICEQPNFAGAGAAGGMGFAAKCFLNSEIAMGIDVILDMVQFDKLLGDAYMVISGEGKLDAQSLSGKVVIGIAKRTKQKNVPLIAIVGDISDGAECAYNKGVTAVFSINRVALTYKELKLRAKDDLYKTMCDVMRLLNAK